MDTYKVEREVNFREISAKVLKEWKKVILIIILLFVALSGFKIKKENDATRSSDMAVASKSLTLEQKNDAEEMFAQYKYYYGQNKNLLSKANSLLNRVDPYETPMIQLELVVTTNVSNIITYFQNLNLTEEQKEQLKDTVNLDDSTSLSDLIFVIDDSDQEKEGTNLNLFTNSDSNNIVLDIGMICVSQEKASVAADVLSEAIKDNANALAEKGYSITITEISRSWNDTYSQRVADYQSNYDSQYDKISTKLKGLQTPSNLTGDVLVYYQALVNDYSKTDSTEEMSFVSAKTLAKNAIVGIVLGIVIVYLAEILKYIKSHTIKTTGDLVLAGSSPVLGIIVPKEQKVSCFSKQIRNLVAPGVVAQEETIRLASLEIEKQMVKRKFKSIFIYYDTGEADSKVVVNQLCTLLKPKFSVNAGSPVNNADAFEKFACSDVVIIVANSYVTPDNIIAKVISMAKSNDLVLIGSLLVKNLNRFA